MQLIILAVIIRLIILGFRKSNDSELASLEPSTSFISFNRKSADYFNTPARRQKWWDNLGEEWRKVFRFQVYDRIDLNGNDIATYILNAESITINLKDITNLDGLQYLTNLKSLTIYNYKSTDLLILRYLKELTVLRIYNGDFSKQLPIFPIFHIKDLTLCNCKINNLYPFTNLINLQALHLPENEIQDINTAKQLPNPIYLCLNDNPIGDFSALSHLKNSIIELSFNQKYNLQELSKDNIDVYINFTNTKQNYDKTFFQNN